MAPDALRTEDSALQTLLEMRSIRKTFPGVVALNQVNLRVRAGEIHALVGENGAGKSTLMKVLSGAGARGLMIDVLQTHGVDSFVGRLAAIVQGSTETTFYVLAVYFGSVGVKHTRHALACALVADAVGLLAAIGVGYTLLR